MADHIDEFLWRGFIPEENRGGTYHVVLNVAGKLVGPLTPQEADKRGWPLSSIVADINAQLMAEVATVRADLETRDAKISELTKAVADRDAVLKQLAPPVLNGPVDLQPVADPIGKATP